MSRVSFCLELSNVRAAWAESVIVAVMIRKRNRKKRIEFIIYVQFTAFDYSIVWSKTGVVLSSLLRVLVTSHTFPEVTLTNRSKYCGAMYCNDSLPALFREISKPLAG